MISCKQLRFLLLTIAVLLSGCQSTKTIPVGFVTELSGRNAVLGVQSRNGAQIAVDEINAGQGIHGQPLELLVEDSTGKQDALLAADQQLIDRQVVAMMGHTTSKETVAALDLMQKHNMILFSPTTSTPVLDQQRDNFFRLIPSNIAQAYPLADYLQNELHLQRVTVLYEADNAAFTQSFVKAFLQHYTELGGQLVIESSYTSSQNPDFASIVSSLRSAGDSDVLLVVASSVETALIAQNVRMQGWQIQIATSNWAYTDELLHNGGRAIEGLLLTSQFNNDCQKPDYLAFKKTYQERYGDTPAFVAAFSYETVQVLAHALEQTGGKRDGLEDAIIQAGKFEGLCDKIVMDEFGDVQRTLYLISIHDGKFEIIREYPPIS
jgi:branched-chain amino acid transport system substrate-binding protein